MQVTVVYPHPVEDVFALLSEPRRRPEWQSSLRRVQMLTDGETGVGSRWYDVTAAVGVRPLMEITEYEPPRVWAEAGVWGGVVARVRIEFDGRQDTTGVHETLVTVTTEVEAPTWRRPVAWGLALLGPAAMRADLRRAGHLLGPGQTTVG